MSNIATTRAVTELCAVAVLSTPPRPVATLKGRAQAAFRVMKAHHRQGCLEYLQRVRVGVRA